MQALCQITPTGKLTDSYDKNEFKVIGDLWALKGYGHAWGFNING